MQGLNAAAPSLAMLMVFALIAGGIWQIRTIDQRQKGWLMIALAVVIFANVLIWSL